MNLQNVVKLADRLANAVEADLEGEDFSLPVELADEESLEAHAALFRRVVARYSRQAAEARQARKVQLQAVARERKAQVELYRRIMADLDEQEAAINTEGAEREAAAKRLVVTYTHALADVEDGL